MPEKTPQDYVVDFFAQFTEEVAKLSVHTGGRTTGERVQEMEQELYSVKKQLEGAQEANAELQDKLAHEQEDRRDQLRAILIGHGLGIDDDTTDELLQTLRTELTALSTLRARVKSQQERLDKRDTNAAASGELTAIREALAKTPTIIALTVDNDDINVVDPVPTINHMVTVLRNRNTTAEKRYEELQQEHNTLLTTHHEWVNGQRTKEPTLSESIQRINDVVTMQIEALSPTSGTGKVVDIRRRMLAKYSIQHDLAHLEDRDLIGAATALLTGNLRTWPWSADTYNNIIADNAQLPTAAALIIAHYDALREAGQES